MLWTSPRAEAGRAVKLSGQLRGFCDSARSSFTRDLGRSDFRCCGLPQEPKPGEESLNMVVYANLRQMPRHLGALATELSTSHRLQRWNSAIVATVIAPSAPPRLPSYSSWCCLSCTFAMVSCHCECGHEGYNMLLNMLVTVCVLRALLRLS